MPNLTKIADWAKTLGISRQQGYAAIDRCEIPVTDGKVDLEYATVLYKRHTRARAGKNSASSASPENDDPASAGTGYETSRARREAAEAEISEIKLAEMAGKYLLKSDVDAAVYEVARALRDGLTNCARRIAGDVAGLADAGACEEVIEREHRQLLESMTHAFTAQVGVSAEGMDE
ncbi:hypothetical protein ACEN9F_13455 [Duganella sp. CT11-25]|uniref:hypothetical protein n=1 Tax=unclassified Duganella TaxID=2636909 RepID=UPI0039AFDCE6